MQSCYRQTSSFAKVATLPLATLCAGLAAGSTGQAQTANSATNTPAQPKVLPEVVVTGKHDSYLPPAVSPSTRSEVPLRQLPQSTQTIMQSRLEDLLARDPGKVVENFSGVVGYDPREINNANYRVRGFAAEAYADGFQLYGNGPEVESLINVQRIDVVKGPTGTLYGGAAGGPLGGLINFVSKVPEARPHYMVGVNGGSFDTYGAVWDLNQPLDGKKSLLFRLTGDLRHVGDQNPFITSELTSLFPTLTYVVSEDTSVTLRGRYSDRSQTDYSGLPAAGTVNAGAFTFGRQAIFRAAGQPDTTSQNGSFGVELKHRFNEAWNVRFDGNYLKSSLGQYSVFPSFFAAPAGSFYTVDSGTLLLDYQRYAANATVNGMVETGPVKHQVSTGLDYDRLHEVGSLLVNPFIGVIDMSNPVYPAFAGGGIPFSVRDNHYETIGLFAQDQLTFAERYHLLGSLRWSQLRIDDVDAAAALNSHTTEQRFTGRTGGSVDVTSWLTAFAGWGQGFEAPIGTVIAAGKKPVTAEQWEVGVKLEVTERLTGSLAWFENTRQNVPVAVGLVNVQTGEQHARGVESDWIWRATDELSLFVNYAYQDARITQDTTIPVGSRLARIPEHSARLAARYDFREGALRGFGAGVGVNLVSQRAGDAANSFFTPSHAVMDAQVSYQRDRYSLAVGIQNLTDTRYYQPYVFFNGGVAPNQPLAVFCQAAVKF